MAFMAFAENWDTLLLVASLLGLDGSQTEVHPILATFAISGPLCSLRLLRERR